MEMASYHHSYLILSIILLPIRAEEYIMGLLAPWNQSFDNFSALTSASAVSIAMDRIRADPSFNSSIDLKVVTLDTNCSSKLALGNAVKMHVEYDVDVFIGPPCSQACKPVAELAAFWNKPIVSWVAANPDFLDASRFPTLGRTLGPFNKMGKFLMEFLNEFGWKQVALLSSSYLLWDEAAKTIRDVLENNNFDISYDVTYRRQLTVLYIDRVLRKIKQEARIVILSCPVWDRRAIMLRAHALGMVTGEYVFITMDITLPKDIVSAEEVWMKNDDNDENAKEAFKAVFHVTLAKLANTKLEDFRADVAVRMRQSPWKEHIPKHIDMENEYKDGDQYAAFLHDAVLLYAIAVNETLSEGRNPRLGEVLVERMKNKRFTGVSGPVILDENADREPDYWVLDMTPDGTFVRIAEYVIKDISENNSITRLVPPRWPDGRIGWDAAPPDVPVCGFTNNLCPEDEVEGWVIGIGIAIPLIGIAFGVIFCVLIYKKVVYENDLRRQNWRIRWEEIETLEGRTQESRSSMSGSDLSSNAYGSSHIQSGVGQLFSKVGLYNGTIVSIKEVKKEHIQLTRQLLVEFKEIKDLQHENLNLFMGACIDHSSICLVWQYCAKGSLQDVLLDSSIKLDTTFKLSFMLDITSAMCYLHKTMMGSHGTLKSSNCLVDGRWTVKVTDYGLTTFTAGQNYDMAEYVFYKRKLWTAPEILRENVPSDRGTQKGDIYSFAIIAYEILQRSEPYTMENVTPRDIVSRVRNGESVPFRPVLPEQCDGGPELLALIKHCWSEDVEERPAFMKIRFQLRKFAKGSINIVDSVLKMMEKYANNLEEIVEERTTQLTEEKKKTDKLLYKMLPASVADSLKVGHMVEPENYDQATVYFSDVVGFTTIASDSSPMQIVDFLNDLYSCFDVIIEKHDVYKVETIGDAYMVVSGVPIRNGTRHVVEIANCSIELLSSIKEFRIRHRPSMQLQLRIGLHTGPVVAGVVGNIMPRYCLFGDTVNMASRMESSGKPLGIHVSKQSYIALKDIGGYDMEPRGEINIKGKGLQSTYWLLGKANQPRPVKSPARENSADTHTSLEIPKDPSEF